MSEPTRKQPTPFWVTFTAGGIAGTVGAVFTCPLEVVKTRLQSSQYVHQSIPSISMALPNSTHSVNMLVRPLYAGVGHIAGTINVLKRVAVEEGVGALWKGVGATIVGVLPARAIYFSSYHRGKHVVSDLTGWSGEDSRVHLTAAALAGASVCTATNPIWLVKTRMQLQSSAKGRAIKYKSSLDCVKTVIREEGVVGLYKGLAASYIGVGESTLQWVIYEKLKQRIDAKSVSTSGVVTPKWFDYFTAAAGAKLVAAVIAYPHEVLRTRMRETDAEGKRKYHTLRQTVRCILKEEGATAFYGGMTAHLMRVVPNSAIMFFVYEFLVHSYTNLAL